MIDKNGALRCDDCGKMVLLHVSLTEAALEFYCPRCHHYHKIQASTTQVAHLTNSFGCAIDKNVA